MRASGSRFGSWMTDAMIPSSDSRVSELGVPETHRILCVLGGFPLSSCCSYHVSVGTLPELPESHFLHAHAHAVFMHITLVVKATVSQLPGMIYITMVTLSCSPLELVPSDELELHSICITFTASVSQLPLGMLHWLEAPLIHQTCIVTAACFSVLTTFLPSPACPVKKASCSFLIKCVYFTTCVLHKPPQNHYR